MAGTLRTFEWGISAEINQVFRQIVMIFELVAIHIQNKIMPSMALLIILDQTSVRRHCGNFKVQNATIIHEMYLLFTATHHTSHCLL